MKIKPAYKRIKQKPYCCVPACMKMILERRKIKNNSQDEIGYELGLIVPKEKADLFSKVRAGKKPKAGYGTQVNKYPINKFFKKYKIQLQEKYFPLSKIKDIKKFIEDNLKQGNDMIVCFDNKVAHGFGDYGHVSLIQGIKENAITLVDPSKKMPARCKVALKKLIAAIKKRGVKHRAGFWVISEK